jgi:hypothetical protein
VIRFSASLVVVGVGLLVAGSVTSRLLLIYIAIGVSAVALLFLIIGAIVNRAELLGREPDSTASGETERDGYAGERDEAPEPATTAVGAGASAGRGSVREHTESPGYGAASTPPDRSRGAVFDDPLSFSDGRRRNRDVPGHDPFPGDEARPSEPQRRTGRPFTDPTPTRMDLSAAAVREAGRQEQERSERDRSERNQPDGNRPGRARPERQPADQPFVDPSPTRLDWAGGLREAEQQERARQEQERRDRDRPERDRAERGQPDQPFIDPSPTRLDWAADLRQGDTRGRATAPARLPGERETAHTSQPADTQPAATQPTPTQPAQAQPAAARPDKLLVSRPDPSDTPSPGSKPDTDQPVGHDAGSTKLPGEQVTSSPAAANLAAASPAAPGPAATSPAGSLAANAASTTESTERPVEVSATREQKIQAPAAAADPPESQAKTGDSKDGSGPGPADSAGSDQDVTVVPGVPRYHRTDCILIRFMGEGDLQRMTVERAQEAGCTPCRACQPDDDEEDD